MILHGKVESGVIVLERDESLPEGTRVTVIPSTPPESAEVHDAASLSLDERRRRLAIIDRIAALPIEGNGEPFSGANHDDVLYLYGQP